ncbi:MAG TPA: universal stress protein [Stellaceae bacterium]|nr:universal stress protein [Stellaceae bacterium]
MLLKDILVCLDPTDAGEARLRLAAGLASEHHAHLSAAYILPEQIAGAGIAGYDGLGFHAPSESATVAEGSLVAGVPAPAAPPAARGDYARRLELTDMVQQRFRETLQLDGISGGEWQLFGAGESEDLLAVARSADLVIYPQGSAEYRLPVGFGAEDLVVAAGRPILVVPHRAEFAVLGRRVLVAWDGSREAARAAHDALPLLHKAELVMLLTVSGSEADFERDRPGLERMLKSYERHGIAARAEEALPDGHAISDVLLSRAANFGTDLIVAGAYHHSRLRESVFGGVTRDLLERMPVPLLLSH